MRHFPNLRDFQRGVTTSVCSLGWKEPASPDLWLIAGDRHKFIEVKSLLKSCISTKGRSHQWAISSNTSSKQSARG